tara:strand:- start:2104 stop:2625 length:522 start_codon:yes stop_codon:yes gene_type:complete
MKLIIYKQHILVGEKKLSQDDVDYIKSIKLSKRKNDIMHTNYFEDFNDEKTISIIKKYEMFFEEMARVNNYKQYQLTKFWIQKYNNDEFHDIHTHGTNDNEYSFILYIDCSEKSSETLFYPLGYPFTCYKGHTPFKIKPLQGRIILFNSFLPHGLIPNKDEKRIILSGNVRYD